MCTRNNKNDEWIRKLQTTANDRFAFGKYITGLNWITWSKAAWFAATNCFSHISTLRFKRAVAMFACASLPIDVNRLVKLAKKGKQRSFPSGSFQTQPIKVRHIWYRSMFSNCLSQLTAFDTLRASMMTRVWRMYIRILVTRLFHP